MIANEEMRAAWRRAAPGPRTLTDGELMIGLQAALDQIDPLSAALMALGKSEREVVGRLRTAKVRGKRQNMYHDPIAAWLNRIGFTGAALFVNNDGSGITVNAGGWVNIPAPAAVVEFVRAFDQGAYPDLALEEN